jgi:hypothetical protein
MGYGAAHLDLILFFRLALAIAFIMLLLNTLKKIFGHHNHQLTSWNPGQRNRVPGFEFSFASQSDLRGIAQKTPLSIRL